MKVSVRRKGRHLTKKGREESAVMEDPWGQSLGPGAAVTDDCLRDVQDTRVTPGHRGDAPFEFPPS